MKMQKLYENFTKAGLTNPEYFKAISLLNRFISDRSLEGLHLSEISTSTLAMEAEKIIKQVRSNV